MKGKMLIISILACVLVFATLSGVNAATVTGTSAAAVSATSIGTVSNTTIAPVYYYKSRYAKVVYISMNGESSRTATVYVAPQTPFPVYYYYFRTSNPAYIDMLSDALGDNSTIGFTGNQNPPTSGKYRYVGTLIRLRVYRNQ